MAREYHSLLRRTAGSWQIEFGDYDRGTVEAERDDYRDHGARAADLRIVTTGSDIRTAVDRLNQPLALWRAGKPYRTAHGWHETADCKGGADCPYHCPPRDPAALPQHRIRRAIAAQYCAAPLRPRRLS